MLVLPREITHTSALTCAHMLTHALAVQQDAVVADASGLQVFDSSALAVLLQCRREAQFQGKHFSVHSLPAQLRALARLYGVAELMPDAP